MNENIPTIRELLAHPKVQGLMSQEDADKIAESLGKSDQAAKDPIYLQILSCIGAWFTAAFLILFLEISNMLKINIATILCGIIFLVAAIIIAKKSKATFLTHLSLALAIAGNILVLIGVADEFNRHEIAAVFITHAIVCAVVYPLYANSIYRFLAPLALAPLAIVWILMEKVFVLMHLLIAAETLLVGILLLYKKRPAMLTPLVYSAAAMLPATLLFMNLTQVNLWRTDFNEPLWPSSILLAGALVYLFLHLAGGLKRLREPWLVLTILSTILLGSFTTPGILVAVGLLIAGYAFGNRILMAISYLFLPCFLVLFYYALNIDLAHKSWVMMGSGVLLLVVRWIAGYCQPKEVTT